MKVFLLAHTKIDDDGSQAWLDHLGVPDWETDASSHSDQLVEVAGRRCYRAFETEEVPVSEQNPNLRRVRRGNLGYLANILRSRHGSVLEHASATLAFEEVSRIFTHEVVRHRAGTAFSQESLRFVRGDVKIRRSEVFDEVLDGDDLSFAYRIFDFVEEDARRRQGTLSN